MRSKFEKRLIAKEYKPTIAHTKLRKSRCNDL